MEKKKKVFLIVGIVVVVLLILVKSLVSSYNGLVVKEEEATNKFSDVSVQLERRADLIPNLVKTVKGYAKHEDKAIENVTKSREKLLKADGVEDKAKANEQLTKSINNLLMIVENYPKLTADKNFIQLQDELAGTENRIAIARKEYNASVKDYNRSVKSFPTKILASIFGFDEKEYFEASEESKEVPDVSFDEE